MEELGRIALFAGKLNTEDTYEPNYCRKGISDVGAEPLGEPTEGNGKEIQLRGHEDGPTAANERLARRDQADHAEGDYE